VLQDSYDLDMWVIN